MVKVIAGNYVKQECTDEFLSVVKELVEKTNKLDPGCIKYEMCRDVQDPLHFVMLEEWETQESLDNHMKAEHFVNLVPKLASFSSKPGFITILTNAY